MKIQKLNWMAAAALATGIFSAQAMAQDAAKAAPQQLDAAAASAVNQVQPQPAVPPAQQRLIVVSLEDRKLALVEDGQVKKVYTVAVGKPSTPSPVGTFTIERRAANPTYHHNGKTVLPGPKNPVGTRWMGLSIQGYGIHGTNEPNSIGKAVSHGCIRMARTDLEEFYDLVSVGDTVELIGQRNEQTARLFGNSENPVPTPQPTITATAAQQTTAVLVASR
jgi:lipoprotein-anchoring transpeptidase ErfK/SrfK